MSAPKLVSPNVLVVDGDETDAVLEGDVLVAAPIVVAQPVQIRDVPIAAIDVERSPQTRCGTSLSMLETYAREMAEGVTFDPVDLCYVGTHYVIVDGHHRVRAAKSLGRTSIGARVITGTIDDATLHACRANREHRGMPRTREDKRKAVETVLALDWATGKSVREIADWCDVSVGLVQKMKEWTVRAPGVHVNTSPQRTTGRDGKSYPAKVRKTSPSHEALHPETAKPGPGKDGEKLSSFASDTAKATGVEPEPLQQATSAGELVFFLRRLTLGVTYDLFTALPAEDFAAALARAGVEVPVMGTRLDSDQVAELVKKVSSTITRKFTAADRIESCARLFRDEVRGRGRSAVPRMDLIVTDFAGLQQHVAKRLT